MPEPVAEGATDIDNIIINEYIWQVINDQQNEMIPNKNQPTEFFRNILQGMKEASRKLVEESAAQGRSLVISVDGKVKDVPAKELLSQVTKTD